MDIKVGKKAIEEASKKLSNWGRWGKDDQIGTLNHVTPEDITKAASRSVAALPQRGHATASARRGKRSGAPADRSAGPGGAMP